MNRERSCTGSVGWATCSMKRSRAALIASLPCSVWRGRLAAAILRRWRSAFSCLRACSRFAASFEPTQSGRGCDVAWVSAGCEPPQPATASTTAALVALSRDLAELRDDLVAVRSERLFLTLGHQVDVELVDADRLPLL